MVKLANLPQNKNNSGLKYIFDFICSKLNEFINTSLIKTELRIKITFITGAYNGL